MKFIFLFFPLFSFLSCFSFADGKTPATLITPEVKADVTPESKPTILGVFDSQDKKMYEEKLLPLIKNDISYCKDCEVTNYTPYNEKGEYNPDDLSKQIAAASDASIILVNWNEKTNPQNKDILDSFTKLSNQGVLIVAAAGQPKNNEASAPLKYTLFGQVPQALIIGELGGRDRLWGSSFFGPEMLTALRPPKDKIGQGLAPTLFAARLTREFKKRKDWVTFLRERKTTTRKIWLELPDCFGR